MLQKLLPKKRRYIRLLSLLLLILMLAGLFSTSSLTCGQLNQREQVSLSGCKFLHNHLQPPVYRDATWDAYISTRDAYTATWGTSLSTSEALVAMPEALITTVKLPVAISTGKQSSPHVGRFFSHLQDTLRKVRILIYLLCQPLLGQLFSIFVSLCFLLFSVFMLQVKQRLSIILYIHHQDGQKGLSVLS